MICVWCWQNPVALNVVFECQSQSARVNAIEVPLTHSGPVPVCFTLKTLGSFIRLQATA